jgi:hypothetical protein
MVDLPGGGGERDPNVLRLSHQYAFCPACQLILPLHDDPDGAPGDPAEVGDREAVPLSVRVARCGLCKRPLNASCRGRWSGGCAARVWRADPRTNCGRGPGLLGLRPLRCQSRQLPRGSPARAGDRGRAGPHRRAGPRPGPAAGGGPGRGRAGPGRPNAAAGGLRPPAGGGGRPAVFAEAFTTAVEGLDAPRERLVARLRSGPDGAPGRTFGQIGQTLGRSPGRARQLLWRAVHSLALAPGPGPDLEPLPARLRRGGASGHRGAGRSHRPTDPARMRALVDRALPHGRPQVSAQLLIKLADLVELEVDLHAWGHDQALCRASWPRSRLEGSPAAGAALSSASRPAQNELARPLMLGRHGLRGGPQGVPRQGRWRRRGR